jgi:hypothetical protein
MKRVLDPTGGIDGDMGPKVIEGALIANDVLVVIWIARESGYVPAGEGRIDW